MTSPTQQQLKEQVAQAALSHLPHDAVLGMGTGSTVNCLIDLLPKIRPKACVSSSNATAERLKKLGIDVIELSDVSSLDVYIDGADEIDANLHMIKGGGGALTREKIVASVARQIICIADSSKVVNRLGQFPLPIEVIPMARSAIARKLVTLGGQPVYREGFVTDNGNVILDTYGLRILDAAELESELNQWPGVVCNGLFARRGADLALIASVNGVQVLQAHREGTR